MKALLAPFRILIEANLEHAYEKRRRNAVPKAYRDFRRTFIDAEDGEILTSLCKNRGLDKWVSVSDFMQMFYHAANVPVHVTPHDRTRYLKPFFDNMRFQIQSGEINDVYMSEDTPSMDGVYLRAADIWNHLIDADLPDGGAHHRAGSFHDRQTANEEVPYTMQVNGRQHKEWLNIRHPMMFALAAAQDHTGFVHTRHPYNRAHDGDIRLLHNSPYLP